jgi:hypothetical protein
MTKGEEIMTYEKCPLCGGPVTVAADRPAWFELGAEPVILAHRPGLDALLNGLTATHPESTLCLATGCSVQLAQGIADDRAAGWHLKAHP